MMPRAKLGDRVQVQYMGTLEDGTAVEFSLGRQVVEFNVGGKEVVPGISFGVVGMAEGEQKRLTLRPGEAYGPVRPKLIREVPRGRFPSGLSLRVGQRLTGTLTSGRRRRVEVVALKPDSVVVDANHPLAGKVLTVEVQLMQIS